MSRIAAVGRKERWAYALGDTGFNFTWATIELYLLFYYIRILDLDPQTASAIFLAGAAIDLVADPLIGSFADRFSRFGLRRLVMLATPFLGLTLAATFMAPATGGVFPWWLLATHLALRLSYSLGNIPYAALTARITSDATGQIALTATRMQGAAIGGLIATALYLLLPLETPAGAGLAGMPTGVIVLALLSQPLLFLSMLNVRERVMPVANIEMRAVASANMLQILRRYASVRNLLILIFVLGLAITLLHKSLLFIFDAMDLRQLGYAVAITPALALLVAAPIWERLSRRFGMAFILRRTVIAFAAFIALAWFASASSIATLTLLVGAVFVGAGLSTLFWALLPQVISNLEAKDSLSGQAAVGRLAGIANLARKLAQTAAARLIALGM